MAIVTNPHTTNITSNINVSALISLANPGHITWEEKSSFPIEGNSYIAEQIQCVASDNMVIVYSNYNSFNNAKGYYYSHNLINFFKVNLSHLLPGNNDQIEKILYIHGTWIMVITSYKDYSLSGIYTSTNGINWTRIRSHAFTRTVTYGNGIYLFGAGTSIYRATELTKLKIDTISMPERLETDGVIFDGQYFVAVSRDSRTGYSLDGINWAIGGTIPGGMTNGWCYPGNTGMAQPIAFLNGRIIVGHGNQDHCLNNIGLAYSSNHGLSWTTVSFPGKQYALHSLLYVNGYYIAATYGPVYYASSDLVNWYQYEFVSKSCTLVYIMDKFFVPRTLYSLVYPTIGTFTES